MLHRSLIGIAIGTAAFFALTASALAAVSVVDPNGGEILCINQAFTIEVTFDTVHTALYYKTDGTQPTSAEGASSLDPSVIKHPDNQTTFAWSPTSGHISGTGRIWVEGHQNNHYSTGDWDVSDANFEVRDCGGGGGGITYIPSTGGDSTSPFLTQAVPNPVEAVAASTSSILYTFQLPSTTLSAVELYTTIQTQEEQFAPLLLAATSTIHLTSNAPFQIREIGLTPNTRYVNRFLRGIVPPHDYTSAFSRTYEPTYTLIETPQLDATSTITTITLTLTNTLSRLGDAFSAISFTNLITGENPGWIEAPSWIFEKLDPDATYQFLARARNGDGVETPYSNLLTIKTLPLPESPQPAATTTVPAVIPQPSPFQDGTLLRASGNFDVWVVEQGSRRHIPNPAAFDAAGYRWDAVKIVSENELLTLLPVRLAKTPQSSAVWYLVGDKRRWIPNPEVFRLYRWSWERVRILPESVIQTYTSVRLLQAYNDFRVWFVEPHGSRRWISSPSVFQKQGFSWDEVTLVVPEEVSAYPEGLPLQ